MYLPCSILNEVLSFFVVLFADKTQYIITIKKNELSYNNYMYNQVYKHQLLTYHY